MSYATRLIRVLKTVAQYNLTYELLEYNLKPSLPPTSPVAAQMNRIASPNHVPVPATWIPNPPSTPSALAPISEAQVTGTLTQDSAQLTFHRTFVGCSRLDASLEAGGPWQRWRWVIRSRSIVAWVLLTSALLNLPFLIRTIVEPSIWTLTSCNDTVQTE